MIRVDSGLRQSLLIQVQRRLLDRVGTQVGTPVLYLKAAWADPVLYEGRGERTGGDVDVLVRPRSFAAYADALLAHGYRRYREPWHMASHALTGKAWLFTPPPGALPVDLHRDVADRPWFTVPIPAWIERAQAYASSDGAILSLSPEDQVVYAAAHYANHRYSLGPQHLDDIVRLLARHSVDWSQVRDSAMECQLALPVALLTEALRSRGANVPALADDGAFVAAWRLDHVRRALRLNQDLQRQTAMNAADFAWLMPALSARPTALPRYVGRALVTRTLDCGDELLVRLGRRKRPHG